MFPVPGDALSHYDTLLARNYAWMAGGFDARIADNARFFESLAIRPSGSGTAIDLGAGCGFQAIPLAAAGFHVVAVDFSRQMLDILLQHADPARVRVIATDIRSTGAWAGNNPELIVCMGDTLTHLPDMASVDALLRQCARELLPGGRMILTFRDYTAQPVETPVIIPVRRDPDRIFLCRLDYTTDRVLVTDILYAKESGTWNRAAGSYPKLRLAPDHVAGFLEREGMVVTREPIPSGSIAIHAGKSS